MIHTPVITIQCNTCDSIQTFEYDTSVKFNTNIRVINRHLISHHGWKVTSDNIHNCKGCQNNEN